MPRDGLVVETTGGWGGGEGGEGGEDRGEEVEEEKEEEVEAGDWDELPNRWQRRRRNSLSLLCRLLSSSLSLLPPPNDNDTGQSVLSFSDESQCRLVLVPLVQWSLPGDIMYFLFCWITFADSNINLQDKYEASKVI